MVESSLARCNRELGDEATLQQGRAISLEDELTCTQKVTDDLEGQVTQLQVQNQLASEELAKVKQ